MPPIFRIRPFRPSISSAAASPAKTFPAPARELALAVLEAASGTRLLAPLTRSSPSGSSSRTSPAAPRDGSTPCAPTWDGSDMRAFRSRLRGTMLARRTDGSGSSSSRGAWASPCRRDVKGPNPNARQGGADLPTQARDWRRGAFPTVTASRYGTTNNGDPHDGRGAYATRGTPSLWTASSRWPTVVVSGRSTALAQAGNAVKPGTSLTDAMREWLLTSGRRPETISPDGSAGSPRAVLNPAFCLALMGFPARWLDVE